MNFINKDVPIPYFFTNKEWFYYDDNEGIYKLTDKATKQARKSYFEIYSQKDDE